MYRSITWMMAKGRVIGCDGWCIWVQPGPSCIAGSFGTKFLRIFRAKQQPPATIDTAGRESCAVINTVYTKVRDKFAVYTSTIVYVWQVRHLCSDLHYNIQQ